MVKRHTFKQLLETVAYIEEGIFKLESALNCHFDQNWCTETPSKIIRAISEGFFAEVDANSLAKKQADTIEELLYHFIYMEDCGNDSEYCRSKLVIVDEGKESQHSVPCTNIDELYDIICTYLVREDLNFHFNYCHSCRDEESKDAR